MNWLTQYGYKLEINCYFTITLVSGGLETKCLESYSV